MTNSGGKRLLPQRVANDEAALTALPAEGAAFTPQVTWAVDMKTGAAVLLLTVLPGCGQQVLYISSTMINRAVDGYRRQGKTDAKDAATIAERSRMRRGLTELRLESELIVGVGMLVARSAGLVADRTCTVNRLREQLLAPCPALEGALDVSSKGLLLLRAF